MGHQAWKPLRNSWCHWSALWCFYRTAQVARNMSIRKGSSCSLRKVSKNMSRGLPIRLVTAGPRWWMQFQSFHHQVNGMWAKRLKRAGKCAGQPYLKPCKLVENLHTVAARKAAEDTASARRLQRTLQVSEGCSALCLCVGLTEIPPIKTWVFFYMIY